MKIGIITILKVNNYGAELQAYATQAVLKRMGYDAEIIDYLFYKNPAFIKTHRSVPLFRFTLKKRLAEFLYPLLFRLRSVKNKTVLTRRENRFTNFHKKNTSMSKTYRSIDELYEAKMNYDVYLTGSDQVWNPGIYSSIAPYFLDFAPKDSKRIAYAASFGVSAIPVQACKYYKNHLQTYDAIGVREKNAVELVNTLANKESKWVLDPTLLLDKETWLQVASPVEVTEPYILLYELTPCRYIRELAEYVNQTHNWQIVRICKNASPEDKDGSVLNIVDAGPAEFLYLFSKASLIITNSFHGSAFAINFQRPFYTVLPLRKHNNSRQRSLLEMFELTDRLLVEGDKYPCTENLAIDYQAVNEILLQERTKSIQFLKNAIEE